MDESVERHIGYGAPDVAIEEEAPSSLVINPHSALGKELRKWEQHRTELVPRGTNPGNPYVFREFPKMLYKAQRQVNGQYACLMAAPHPYAYERADQFNQAVLAFESFNRSCCRVVGSASEEALAKGQGWANDPVQAMTQYEAEQQAIGNAAAEAAAAVRGMTAQARDELKAADASTHQHVTDLKGSKKGAKAVTAVEGD